MDYKVEYEKQEKFIQVLQDNMPSGLTAGQARQLNGELEEQNKQLKTTVSVLTDKIMNMAEFKCIHYNQHGYIEYGHIGYCDHCPLARIKGACSESKHFSK